MVVNALVSLVMKEVLVNELLVIVMVMALALRLILFIRPIPWESHPIPTLCGIRNTPLLACVT